MHMPTNQLVNVSEVADMLGISKRTVHQRIGAGRIAPIQKMPGQTGQYLFDRSYIVRLSAWSQCYLFVSFAPELG